MDPFFSLSHETLTFVITQSILQYNSCAAVACGYDTGVCWSHCDARKHLQAVRRLRVLECVSRGTHGQSVSDCNSHCLYDTTTDVMKSIERWYVCLCLCILHYTAVTAL